MLTFPVAALAAPAPYVLREAAQNVTPKAREPTFAPLAPCDAGFVPTCEQAKGFGLCDSANAACDEACVDEVKMACPVTCSLSAEATSGHLAPDAAPSDYGKHLPPVATEAICSTCAAQPDLPCCHDHPHEGNSRRRLQSDTCTACGVSSTTLAEAQAEGCHTVTGVLIDGGAIGDVSLPNLRYVYRGIEVRDNANLASLTMPNLERVGGRQRGGITVAGNDNFVSLTMPNLERVHGDITVDPKPDSCDLGRYTDRRC